jgi:hypothetical protein
MSAAPVSATPLSPRAARLAAGLASRKTRRVRLDELWRLLDEADPALGMSVRRRAVLRETLDELARHQLVAMPSPRSFDRLAFPELPQFVTLPRADPAPGPQHDPVWHPHLRWVPGTPLPPTQRADLEKINDWLHACRRPTPIPLHERSLEIFGDEKRLDRLLTGQLFGGGRLSLDRLATYRAVVRFTSERVGIGDLLLVAENSDTFDSLARVLARRSGHRVGRVGWGAGGAFEASVLSVAHLDPPVAEVAYFGDLDEKGLRIPANAAAMAARERLPPVRPAHGLYDALLRRMRPGRAPRPLAAATATELAVWLGPSHRKAVEDLLTSGRRAAQEAVTRDYLTTHDDWLTDLI